MPESDQEQHDHDGDRRPQQNDGQEGGRENRTCQPDEGVGRQPGAPSRKQGGAGNGAGRDVGIVAEVLHTPGGELLAVDRDQASELLVPFVSAIVTSVSLQDRIVEIDPPEGLLELEQ